MSDVKENAAEEETPSSLGGRVYKQKSGPGFQLPPWSYLLLALLGVPLSGVGGATYGAQQTTKDLQRLEEKVDVLTEKNEQLYTALINLQVSIIKLHRNDPDIGNLTPGVTP